MVSFALLALISMMLLIIGRAHGQATNQVTVVPAGGPGVVIIGGTATPTATSTGTPTPTPTSTFTPTPSPAPTAQHAGVGSCTDASGTVLNWNVDASPSCVTPTATATSTPSPTPTPTPAPTASPLFAGYVFPTLTAVANTFTNGVANHSEIWWAGILQYPQTWNHICINVQTLDASNHYDTCIYNGAGVLLGDTGAMTLPSTGYQCFSIMANASCTGSGTPSTCCTGSGTGTCPTSVTTQGEIVFFTTGDNATAKFYNNNGSSSASQLIRAAAGPTTSNGICPASITAPTISPFNASYAPLGALY